VGEYIHLSLTSSHEWVCEIYRSLRNARHGNSRQTSLSSSHNCCSLCCLQPAASIVYEVAEWLLQTAFKLCLRNTHQCWRH